MYWQLTNDIWWGDYRSVSLLTPYIGSVINVCSDNDLLMGGGYNPFSLPGRTPYFRMALGDRDYPDKNYMESVEGIIRICLNYKPVLIHCYAGMHRSPSLAVLAAMIDRCEFTKELFFELTAATISLNPKVKETQLYNYRLGVQTWIMLRIEQAKRLVKQGNPAIVQ